MSTTVFGLLSLSVLAVAVYCLHAFRNYWARKDLDRVYVVPFDGNIFNVGRSVVAKRATKLPPQETIVCIPGYLEDMRYFTDLYKDSDVELILVNCADYHSPFPMSKAIAPSWGQENPYKPSTIQYDAYVVAEAVANIASTPKVTLHGHSRGGAVMLDAGKQRPELMREVKLLLEAPVLPQGKMKGNTEKQFKRVGAYSLPLLYAYFRHLPVKILVKTPLMHPLTDLKKELFPGFFCAPKRYSVAIKNVYDLIDWQKINTFDLYDNFKSIDVLIGERDYVLCRRSMLASANSSSNVKITETQGTNHFIALDNPRAILEAIDLA